MLWLLCAGAEAGRCGAGAEAVGRPLRVQAGPVQVEMVGRGLGDRFAGSGWVGMGAHSHDGHSVLDRLGDWCVNDWNTGGKLFEWKADSKGLPWRPCD